MAMDAITQALEHWLTQSSQGHIGSSFLAFGLAYLGGILSSFTPCIYPMIPITVGVMGSGLQRGRSTLTRGISYVFGMSLVYAFLGVLAGLTGKVFGSFTNTPGWYLGLGLVMTFAALVMMDVIPFDPAVTLDRIKRALGSKPKDHTSHEDTSLFGAFLLGASSGFIAAPCTTPVLTAILGFIAQTQSLLLGLGFMLAFAWGLGTLLLLVSSFAGSLKKLPRSGQWMTVIKIGSGLLILGFAEYLIFKSGTLS